MRNCRRIARNLLFCETGLVNQYRGTLGRLLVTMVSVIFSRETHDLLDKPMAVFPECHQPSGTDSSHFEGSSLEITLRSADRGISSTAAIPVKYMKPQTRPTRS